MSTTWNATSQAMQTQEKRSTIAPIAEVNGTHSSTTSQYTTTQTDRGSSSTYNNIASKYFCIMNYYYCYYYCYYHDSIYVVTAENWIILVSVGFPVTVLSTTSIALLALFLCKCKKYRHQLSEFDTHSFNPENPKSSKESSKWCFIMCPHVLHNSNNSLESFTNCSS